MKLLRATDAAIPVIGALITLALLLAGRMEMAIGSTAGVLIATVSWIAMHRVGRRLVRGGSRNQALLAMVLGLKLVVVATLVFLAVHVLDFSGLGVAAGLGCMPLGIILMFIVAGPPRDPEGEADDGQPVTEVKGDA